jgi:hypothetical protein
MNRHYSEDDLTIYYYGEARRREDIDAHLGTCAACAATYKDIAATLALLATPAPPARGEQYGLEVWQRIRHKLPEQDAPWWAPWVRADRLAWAAAAAMVVVAAFVAGRVWERQPPPPAATSSMESAPGGGGPRIEPPGGRGPRIERRSSPAAEVSHRILLTSVADHLDRSERLLTDIMNAPDQSDIATEQTWADDLLTTSRLYRQDAIDAGEQSVATVLDELERSLIEIVHSPSHISAADLEQIRRRIDAAALLFKVRVLGDELRQRDAAPARKTG